MDLLCRVLTQVQLSSLNESKLAVTYEVELSHLTKISEDIFRTWLRNAERKV